jgi:hypothetical protein
MDLSFNISGAGPLSQISAHIVSYDTAVWLASGAIGWWKAWERSKSLLDTLTARKASLVPTSSFNYTNYCEIRKSGTVVGLAVQSGVLKRLTGVESTAVTRDPGIDCLRALTTGLLTFFSVQLTTVILADIIPYGLLHADQEDNELEFTGPLFASLNDWVKAVAAEEDCNNFRQLLLQIVSKRYHQMTGMQALQPNVEDGFDELGLLLGCLRWMVTPIHRRTLLKYPTRSIRVWTTMAIMSKLGFAVLANLDAVHSKEQYQAILEPPHSDNFQDVILVSSAVGKTDPWIVMANTFEELHLRPQIIPILSIPNAVFGRLQSQHSFTDAAELIDIWNVCFRHAKEGVSIPTLSRDGKVLLEATSSDCAAYRQSHKALIGLWSPHLARIMRPAFDDYLPKTLDGNWSPEAIKAFLDRQSSGERIYLEDVEVARNVYKLKAMILGTIYGACSIALCAQIDDKTGQCGVEALEIALSPDVIFYNKVFTWASTLGSAFGGLLDHSGWTGLMIELVTGIDHPQPLDEQPALGPASKSLNVAKEDHFDTSNARISDIVGAQVNGVFVVSEFILRPSTSAASSLLFHVGVGRILDIPVDQTGYVRSSRDDAASIVLTLDPEPDLDHLALEPNPHTLDLRIDAEPHWLSDPRTICFAVRRSGALVASLDIPRLLERLVSSTVECGCDNPIHQISVPRSERWQNVSVHQLVQSGVPGVSKSSCFIEDNDKILINAGHDDACRVYTTAALSCRKLAICRNCVSCAYNRVRNRNGSIARGSAAIVVG